MTRNRPTILETKTIKKIKHYNKKWKNSFDWKKYNSTKKKNKDIVVVSSGATFDTDCEIKEKWQ